METNTNHQNDVGDATGNLRIMLQQPAAGLTVIYSHLARREESGREVYELHDVGSDAEYNKCLSHVDINRLNDLDTKFRYNF